MSFFSKLFKSSSSKQPSGTADQPQNAFRPFIQTTDNVPVLLAETAKRSKLSPNALDFILLHDKTFIKKEKQSEWIELEDDDWQKYNTSEYLLNPDFAIMQEYEVEVIAYKEPKWIRDLILQIGTNKNKDKVGGLIKRGSVLHNAENLDRKLAEMIARKMVRNRLFIGLWESDFMETLQPWIAQARVNGKATFEEDLNFDISAAIAPQPSVDDAIILHYEERQKQKDSDKVDHARRGFIQGVEKDEAVIEYVKARKGIPGRSCSGEFLSVEEPVERHKPEFSVDDTIEIIDDDRRRLYKAKQGGYVVFKENRYGIKEEMDVDEISFKKTGSIEAGVDTEVKISVSESDVLKDAIGTNVEVEATEVKVEGNVGPAAKVLAETVVIGGQTHQSSRIECKNAQIHVHRGKLLAEEADINRLEGGYVEAKRAKISQIIGGEVRAFEIDVEVLTTNCKLFGISRIEVGRMRGENNKLAIDPEKITAFGTEINELGLQKEVLTKERDKLKEKWNEREAIRQKSIPVIRTLRKRVAEEKAKGIQPKSAFITKIKQFQKFEETQFEATEQLKAKETAIGQCEEKLLGYQKMVLEATIINHGAWGDYTDITFQLLTPPMTLHLSRGRTQCNETISLKKTEDDQFEIQVVPNEAP